MAVRSRKEPGTRGQVERTRKGSEGEGRAEWHEEEDKEWQQKLAKP